MKKLTAYMTFLLSQLALTSALATGGFVCNGEIENGSLSVQATTGRVFGNPLVDPTRASLELSVPSTSVMPTVRITGFQKQHFVGYYNLQNQLDFILYTETDIGPNATELTSIVVNTDRVSSDSSRFIGVIKGQQIRQFPNSDPEIIDLDGTIVCDQE